MNNQTNSNAKPMYTGPAPLTGGYPQWQIQQQAQQNVPYQGMYNGNPGGAYNMPSQMNQQYGYAPSPYNMQYQGGQSSQLGRYVPPTMQPGSQGLYNSNQWNNNGGYQYNLPNAYGQTGLNYGQGQGQAPMPSYQGMASQAQGALAQQMFSDPSMLNPQDRAFFNQQFQGMFNQNTGQSPMQQTNFGQMYNMGNNQGQGQQRLAGMMNAYFSDPSSFQDSQLRDQMRQQLQGLFSQNTGPSPMQQVNFGQQGQMLNRQQWQGANSGVGAAPTVDDTAARQALLEQRANDLRQRQWNQVLGSRGGRVNFPGGG